MLEILQIYWWCVISIIGGLLVFMFFVQGGQILAVELSKTKIERDLMLNSVGRKWEITYTTLVLFGGANFAAFPLFYSTSFGGAYWVWLAILFCFTIQAVSYEFRLKPNNFLGQKTYDAFLYINGSLGVILIGIAVSTFFSGSEFSLDERNFVYWQSPWRGLEALGNPFNYLLGAALFFLSRSGAASYFVNNIKDDILRPKFRRAALVNSGIFVVFFLAFLAWICLKDGFVISGNEIIKKQYAYLLNFIEIPIISVSLLIGITSFLFSVYLNFKSNNKAIWAHGVGVVFAVTSVFLVVGLGNLAFYPSNFDLNSSLTLKKASSSEYTLIAMSVISLFSVVVLGYLAFAWKKLDLKPITREEIEKSEHKY